MAENDVFLRLSKYDADKYPPFSPERPKPKEKIGPVKNKEEIEEIVNRLKQYDAYKGPPESRLHKNSIM